MRTSINRSIGRLANGDANEADTLQEKVVRAPVGGIDDVVNANSSIEMSPTFSGTQSKIVSLLNTFANESDAFQASSIDLMQHSTSSLIDNFRANVATMEGEFQVMIERFKDGNFTVQEFEMLLDGENKKGVFTLDIAQELMMVLNSIFDSVKEMVVLMKSGEQVPSTSISTIVETLDQSMESVLGISRIAASVPKDVLRNMNIVQIQKGNLKDDADRGHFMQMMKEFQEGKLISNYNTKEVTFEEAIDAFSAADYDQKLMSTSDEYDNEFKNSSGNITAGSNSTGAEPSSPSPIKKTVRIHTFKVESSYRTRAPVFQKIAAKSGVASPEQRPSLPPMNTTVTTKSQDVYTQTDSLHKHSLQTSTAFSLVFYPKDRDGREKETGTGGKRFVCHCHRGAEQPDVVESCTIVTVNIENVVSLNPIVTSGMAITTPICVGVPTLAVVAKRFSPCFLTPNLFPFNPAPRAIFRFIRTHPNNHF